MDHAERVAERYLKGFGFSSVEYEPDGNVPPDFLCDQSIAVEVRRMGQLDPRVRGRPKALEEDSIPLHQKMRNVLATLGPSEQGQSWYVFYRFKRPLPKWMWIADHVTRSLQVIESTVLDRHDIEISENFQISLYRASTGRNQQRFVLGGYLDKDAGGWLLAILEAALRACIEEKTQKISGVRQAYAEWWLILVDYVTHGLDDDDRELFKANIRIPHEWDRVVVLGPEGKSREIEV